MTTTAGITLHVDWSEVSHAYRPVNGQGGGYGTLDLGMPGPAAHAFVFFHTTAEIDIAIAELVALRQEMAPPAPGRVPWRTGACDHPVHPGAWALGLRHCRDCIEAGNAHAGPVAGSDDGEQRADGEHPQGNPYPDGTPWCAPCGTHHEPASVTV